MRGCGMRDDRSLVSPAAGTYFAAQQPLSLKEPISMKKTRCIYIGFFSSTGSSLLHQYCLTVKYLFPGLHTEEIHAGGLILTSVILAVPSCAVMTNSFVAFVQRTHQLAAAVEDLHHNAGFFSQAVTEVGIGIEGIREDTSQFRDSRNAGQGGFVISVVNQSCRTVIAFATVDIGYL